MAAYEPKTEEELGDLVAGAVREKTPLEICGLGSKRALAPEPEGLDVLSLAGLSGILSYEPEELVISAWAGTPLDEIEEALAERNQHLAFEPPDLRGLLGGKARGTIGGAVASGLSGPRRLSAGAVRDHVLGLVGMTGKGQAFQTGGRVVKNVTGYDLSKLCTGSWGRLAVLSRVTLKVLPAPPETRALIAEGLAPEDGARLLRRAAASPYQVSGSAMVIEEGSARVLLRLEGRADEIDRRAAALTNYCEASLERVETDEAIRLWQDVRDLRALEGESEIWRLNGPRAKCEEFVAALPGSIKLVDWAGARIWFSGAPLPTSGWLSERGARAQCFLGESLASLPPASPALAALEDRVHLAFDPYDVLNPHRARG